MLIDLDLDLTASNQIKQFAGQIGLFCRVSNVIGKCRASQVQRAFDCQQYRVERRDRAGCSANTDHQATALEGVQRAREGVFADTVKHHVYANAAGQLAGNLDAHDASDDLLLLRVDDYGAVGLDEQFNATLSRLDEKMTALEGRLDAVDESLDRILRDLG